jgi:PAS domain S-box-containing protein
MTGRGSTAEHARLRVLIADDDRTVREALADLLQSQEDLELVGTAVDHPGTISAAVSGEPDVILMDLRMPAGSAAETIRTLRERVPRSRVLALSAYEDADSVLEAIEAGAHGYLVKGTPGEEILQALHRARRDQLSLSAPLAIEVLAKLKQAIQDSRRAEELLQISPRQFHALFDRSPNAVILLGPDGRIQLVNERTLEMFGYPTRELIGQPATILLPQRYRDSDPVRVAAGGGMQVPCRRRGGSEFPASITVSTQQSKDQLIALFIRDITDLRRAQRRYLQVLDAFPKPVLIIDGQGVIGLVSPEAERTFGYDHGELIGVRIDEVLAASTMDTLRLPQALPELLTTATLQLTGQRKGGGTFGVNAEIRSLEDDAWMVAINAPQRPESEWEITRAPVEQTNERQVRNLLANLIRGQEEERQRIATGIHDDTLQVITAVALRVQQLRRRLSDPKDLEVLGRLDETVQLAISRLRHLIFDLRPPLLERGGLGDALRSYLEQLRAETGVRFTLHDELESTIPDAVRALVYRIAHEALTNVRRHAQASQVSVAMTEEGGGLRVRIDDDGVGFDPDTASGKAGHLGLRAIRERAALAGGWSRVIGVPGAGSTVEFWVPIGDFSPRAAESDTS